MSVAELKLTAAELGEVLGGLTARRIRQLAEDGTFPRPSRGKFPLVACVSAYLALRESATDGDELKRERAGLVRAQRRRVELENSVSEGKLVDVETVATAWEGHIARARAKFLAMPDRLALPLAAEPDPQRVAEVLRQEIHAALHELADEGEEDDGPDDRDPA